MPTSFALIGSAWNFFRKHTILNQVLGWLMVIPITLSFWWNGLMDKEGGLGYAYLLEIMELSTFSIQLLKALLNLGLSVWLMWGFACVLIVGKRIVQSSAGRSRSSFSAVRNQGGKVVIPLLLTDILRDCFTVLWLLVLFVPGVIYRVRTSFFAIIMVSERKEYRDALKASEDLVKGFTFDVLIVLMSLAVLLFLPAIIFTAMAQTVFTSLRDDFFVAADIISASALSVALVLFVLSIIYFYRELKELKS